MEKKKPEVDPDLAIKRLPVVYGGLIVFFTMLAIVVTANVKSLENDLLNSTALVIEVGFGIAITWTVYVYSKKWSKENKVQQKNIAKLIENQEKFRNEQHDFAIHRVRSYLSSLHSTINSLMSLDIDPNIPVNKELDSLIQFKKEMVTQLDHIVNQSGAILEQHYLQRLTDIIELSRTNPKPSETDDGLYYLDISHCQGILSQIEDLLKTLPNPPV